MNVSLDAKAQLPYLHHTFGTSHLFSLYAIGGYTHTSFKNVGLRVNSPEGTAVFTGPVDSWQNQNGWNAGGGASLMWGRTELFVESRVLAFTPENAPMARQVPYRDRDELVLRRRWLDDAAVSRRRDVEKRDSDR